MQGSVAFEYLELFKTYKMQDTTFDNTTLNLSDFDLFDFDDPHFETKQRIRIALASSMYLVTFVFGSIGMGKVNSELSI
jgi:hypothetical protein